MKKLSILIALLVVAAFGFAQDVTIDGDATLTLGYDLDTGLFGFKNEASAELEVKWTFDDAEAGGTGAFIKLTGMDFTAEDDGVDIDDPSVEAGLIFAPLTITIYDAPDIELGSAEGYKFVPDDPDDPRDVIDPAIKATNTGTAASSDVEFEAVATGKAAPKDAIGGVPFGTDGTFDYYIVSGLSAASGSFQGLTVTADLAPLTVDLMIVSDGDWEDNALNGFAYGLMVGADIAPLTVEAGVIYGKLATDAEFGATLGVSGTFGPASVDLGLDFFDSDIDTSIGVGLDLGVASIDSLTYLTLIQNAAEEYDVEGYQELVIDASAAVEGLTLKNTTQLDTFFTPTEWYNGTDLAYDLGGIKPYAMVELYDTDRSDADFFTDVEAGVELTGQIELTTFKLGWQVDKIGEDSTGEIFFSTKIEY